MPSPAEPLQIEVVIKAEPETVFAFLTEPEKMKRWMGGRHVLDTRPGGLYRVDLGDGHVQRGEFREIQPFSRIVLTWGWEMGGVSSVTAGSTLLEFDLTPQGSDTRLRLTHSGLSDELAYRHGKGWIFYLERLVAAARVTGRATSPRQLH